MTAHNAKFIVDNKIGPGAIIRVSRSGDVIPKIVDIVKPAKKASLPSSEYKWKWDSGQVNIVLLDKQQIKNSPEIQVQVVEHFFKTIGVERIKAATLRLFVDAGYQNVIQILKMTRSQFVNIEGGTKTLSQVWEQMQEKLAEADLATLMDASSVFGRGFGTRRCSMITKAMPNVMSMSGDADLAERIDEIEGFDAKTATMFADRLPTFVKWLAKSGLKPARAKVVKKTGNKLAGQRVLFTGFRDVELEQLIQQNGGEVASGVSKATILLAKDPSGTSSKLDAARKLNVKIMSGDQFRRKYGL